MWVALGLAACVGAVGGYFGGVWPAVLSSVLALVIICVVFYLIGWFFMKQNEPERRRATMPQLTPGSAAADNRQVILKEMLKMISKPGLLDVGIVSIWGCTAMKMSEEEATFFAAMTIATKEKSTGVDQEHGYKMWETAVLWSQQMGPDTMRLAVEHIRKVEAKYGLSLL
jgi:hypothetical protein